MSWEHFCFWFGQFILYHSFRSHFWLIDSFSFRFLSFQIIEWELTQSMNTKAKLFSQTEWNKSIGYCTNLTAPIYKCFSLELTYSEFGAVERHYHSKNLFFIRLTSSVRETIALKHPFVDTSNNKYLNLNFAARPLFLSVFFFRCDIRVIWSIQNSDIIQIFVSNGLFFFRLLD